ncbi:MAG: uracil-DNA glycosylase [Cetobacterium sp.]|nr:uracil-DNA glycosylase [Cetobacterium sp.]
MDKEILWDELKFEIGSIEGLNGKNKSILLGSGNKEGKILFIGEDTDLYISEDLKVANGSAGEFLLKLCDIVDIEPDDYYITTLTKSSYKYRELVEREQNQLRELLDMQIALINPKLIVAMGEDVGKVLLNREVNFLKERGKVQKWQGDIKLVLTYDADFAKKSRDDGGRKSKVALEFWNDLKTAKEEIKK